MKPATINIGDAERLYDRAQEIFAEAPHALAVFDSLAEAAKKADEKRLIDHIYLQDLNQEIGRLAGDIRRAERDKESPGIKWSERDQKQFESTRAKFEKLQTRRAEVTPKDIKTTPEERRRDRMSADLNGGNAIAGQQPDYGDWIKQQGPLARFTEKRAELPSGDFEKALSKAEQRLVQICHRVIEIRSAPVDAETAVAEMRRQVEAKARKGTPKIDPVTIYAMHGLDRSLRLGEVEFPFEHTFTGDGDRSIEGELGTSFACWLFKDQIIERLESAIRERVGKVQTFSIEARTKEEAALRAEWLDVQRLQVRLCEELGKPLPLVHPLALFGVERGEDREAPPSPEVKYLTGAAPTIGVSHAAMGIDAGKTFIVGKK